MCSLPEERTAQWTCGALAQSEDGVLYTCNYPFCIPPLAHFLLLLLLFLLIFPVPLPSPPLLPLLSNLLLLSCTLLLTLALLPPHSSSSSSSYSLIANSPLTPPPLRALEAASHLGGDGLEPFYALLEGGRSGQFFAEMEEYFYYAQIRR